MEEKDLNNTPEMEQQEPSLADEMSEVPVQQEVDLLKAELAEQKEKFIRLYAEFDNFKRRSAKERI